MSNNDILMVASLENIRALNDIAEATADKHQRKAAIIANQALLALRDTINRPTFPACYTTRMSNIRKCLR